ncbi:ATP-binding protein [Kitasatospora sp. NPDC089797]|uniref:ATP-binding protein n=1 Tax=Kitasatospora sp. NPDC089797 TaxID=3155298 RepID=UPI00343F4386
MSHTDGTVAPDGPGADAARPRPRPRRVVTAGDARALLAELVRTLDGDTDRLLADVELAATELVVNAHRHAGGLTGFHARIDHEHRRIVVEVEDADDRHPAGEPLDQRAPEEPGGRGWALVQILAHTCRIEPLPDGGKRISATFAF